MFGWGKDSSRRSGYLMGTPDGTMPPTPQPASPIVAREVLPVTQPAVEALPPVSDKAPAAPREIRAINPRHAVALGICSLFAIFAIEAILSSTALITPINPTFLLAMRAFGVMMGLCLWAMLMLATGNLGGQSKPVLAGLVLFPLFGGWVLDGIAWRLEDLREFGFSTAAFAPARYPVKWISQGRKGRRDVLQIDPYGAGMTDIPIPEAQYDALWIEATGQCVTVLQRRSASGAIEVRTDGQFTLFAPAPVQVAPCDAT